MKKRFFLVTALSPLALWATEKQPPNFVFVLADDCRFMDLGCYGSPDAITPCIDRLATEGMLFRNFFQATAMSSPTRQCLMTGLYPVKSGAYPNHTFVNQGTLSIVHYLRTLNYRVALQGKRHINPVEAFPFDYLGEWQHVNEALIEPFFQEMAEQRKSFCLFVCSNDPHMPWTRGNRTLFDAKKIALPPFIVDTPETRRGYVNYLAEINQLDSDVGKVDALLKKYHLDENTVFIFSGEHGFTLPFSKWTCYSQGLQTAFIVRWPKVIKPGSVSSALCEYVDVVPTFIEIAGGKVPDGLDGKSFFSVLTGDVHEHKSHVYGIQTSRGIVYGSEHYAVRSVFDGRYRYLLNLSYQTPFRCIQMQESDSIWSSWCRLARTNDFARRQVERYVYRPEEELYDLQNDPFELCNLATDEDSWQIKIELKQHLLSWMASQGDQGLDTEIEALKHMTPESVDKFEKTKNKIPLPQ